MAHIRTAIGMVGVKLEATPFTYGDPGAGAAFNAFDISYTPEPLNDQERNEVAGHMGVFPELRGGAMCELSFSLLHKGGNSAADDVPTQLDPCFLAAGLLRDATATTGPVDYKPTHLEASAASSPDADPGEAYSFCFWEDGIQYAGRGGRANMELVWTANAGLQYNFRFRGAYVAAIDAAIVVPALISTAIPPVFKGATLTVHGQALECESLTLDLGNEFSTLIDSSDSNGAKGVALARRRITGSVTPAMELIATHDIYGIWKAGTLGAINTGVLGSATGNKVSLSIPITQYRAPSHGDREGIRSLDLPFSVSVAQNATVDDGFTLSLT